MFTGIVEETGKVQTITNKKFVIEYHEVLENTKISDGITINGISLTIAKIEDSLINLAIIPHTYENTSLKCLKIGDLVNIEVDIIAKYIEKFLSTSDNKSRIDIDFLQRNGFY